MTDIEFTPVPTAQAEQPAPLFNTLPLDRSEERRVGKEC